MGTGGLSNFLKVSVYLGLCNLELNLLPEHLSVLIKFSNTAKVDGISISTNNNLQVPRSLLLSA